MASKSILNNLMVSTTPLDPVEVCEWENRIKRVEVKIEFVNERVEVVKNLIEKNNKLISDLMKLELSKRHSAMVEG